jgi:hypothetical protein
MPLIYRNTRTGRVAKVPTPGEAAARSSQPKRARRRQEKLLEAMDECSKWVSNDQAAEQWSPAPAQVQQPVQREQVPAVTEAAQGHDEPAEPTGPVQAEPEPSLAVVRAWARESGIEVSARGRLPQEVIDAYKQAHNEGGGEDA